MVQSYQDLEVWKRGMELSKAVYLVTRRLPREETYGLVSQMRRAVISIPSNIAEGWGRQTTKQYIQFLQIAQGSAAELETQLLLTVDLEMLKKSEIHTPVDLLTQIRKMLRSLIGALKRKGNG
jgi:four helix bundle protein